MRSYYAHLKTVEQQKQGTAKPTFRSSAIFPVMNMPDISSRILFMGYWILKRNIKEIAAVITLRSLEGKVLHRTTLSITEPKTYRIELKDQLEAASMDPDGAFEGSLEIEFFSTQNFVFPFPATVLNYYGHSFSSVVHTAQRVYNDYEDMKANSQTIVPESGFNIYADNDKEPFIGLVNGCQEVENGKFQMTFYNSFHDSLAHTLELGKIHPYQTIFIYPNRHVDLKTFLRAKVGACKALFQVNWAFPRLIVGNLDHRDPSINITHTYYDCSKAESEDDYWFITEPGWYPASLMIPVSVKKERYTNVYFYPIYSPAIFDIDVEIYQANGKLLGKKENALHIRSPLKELLVIPIKSICDELEIPIQDHLAARIIAKTTGSNVIPSRIKIGLDIGRDNQHLPCNICTNLQPFNPSLETKPRAFRWSPVLTNEEHPSLWILNSSPAVDYQRESEVEVTFFREKDTETIIRKIKLPPNGFIAIRPNDDAELRNFYNKTIGWMTAVSNNPYTTTFYFVEHASGVVGGDHGF